MKSRKISKLFLNIAREFSQLSHCVYDKRGAVIVKNGNIIGIGINGTLSGVVNCNEVFSDNKNINEHNLFSHKWEIEAELNAILRCSRQGISCEDAEIYTSHIPNFYMIKYIAMAGIRSIYYKDSSDCDNVNRINEICSYLNVHIEQIDD